jgi:OPA family glycerol-3-phosphate transporter-like MFS transporter
MRSASSSEPSSTVPAPSASSSRRLASWQALTVALMVIGYAGCYLCRSNFSVSLGAISASLVERGYTADDARVWLGWAASFGTLAYAMGKLVSGSLADFLGGRRNVLMGMLGSVLFTVWFALGGSLPVFTLAWVGNRAVQSLCWVGIVKITGRWFSYSAYGTAMGVVSLSYLFGDAAARWFMGWLMEPGAFAPDGLSWRQVFWVAAGGLLVCWTANWLWLYESPGKIGETEPAANPVNVYGARGSVPRPASLGELLLPLLASPLFLVVCVISLGLTLLRETLSTWSPTYFVQTIGSSGAEAATQSALFPLLGGASVLVAGWCGDRLGRNGRAIVILAGCGGASLALWVLGSLEFASGSRGPIWLVGLVVFLMLGPYSYLAGAISLDLGGKQGGATACGIIDGVGYLGGFLAGGSVAQLSVAYGWSGAFRALAGVALATSAAAAVYYQLQRTRLKP